MWSWYQTNQITSPTSTPYSGNPGIDEDDDSTNCDKRNSGGERTQRIANQRFPRTMFDLIEMNAAAKVYQWGEENERGAINDDSSSSSDSTGTSDSEEDFYQSDGSSESNNSGMLCVLYYTFFLLHIFEKENQNTCSCFLYHFTS